MKNLLIDKKELKNYLVSYMENGIRKKFYVQCRPEESAKEMAIRQGANPCKTMQVQALRRR